MLFGVFFGQANITANQPRTLSLITMGLAFVNPLSSHVRLKFNQGLGRRNRVLVPVCCADERKDQSRKLPAGRRVSRPANGQKVGFVGSETIGISFTCNANNCNQRITKTIKRRSYEKGTVLIQCPSCNKHHIIADNMGMYTHLTGGKKNVEEIAKSSGQNVSRVNPSVFGLEKLICEYYSTICPSIL